jgi:hypothetical protein
VSHLYILPFSRETGELTAQAVKGDEDKDQEEKGQSGRARIVQGWIA